MEEHLCAYVITNGNDVQVWVEYGPTTDYGFATRKIAVAADGTGAFYHEPGTDLLSIGCQIAPGLIPGETYHYRAVASYSGGTVYGDDWTVKIGSPLAFTQPSIDVTDTSATLVSDVDHLGWVKSYHFEYGPTSDYGNSTPERPAPDVKWAARVYEPITGLTPNTTYHVRTVIDTQRGPGWQNETTFTTLPAPPPAVAPVTPEPTPPPASKVVVRKQSLRTALRHGLKSTVTCSRACRVSSSVFVTRGNHLRVAGRKPVAHGSGAASTAAVVAVRSLFGRDARHGLAHAHSVRVAVLTAVTDASGQTKTITSVVVLKR